MLALVLWLTHRRSVVGVLRPIRSPWPRGCPSGPASPNACCSPVVGRFYLRRMAAPLVDRASIPIPWIVLMLSVSISNIQTPEATVETNTLADDGKV